jgi:hypothetical protein
MSQLPLAWCFMRRRDNVTEKARGKMRVLRF